MSIGRIQFSGATASAESTIALANLNFDFSLVKVDAPAEFKALGECLNDGRLTSAEEGSLHITARRLGAAFERLLPQTPHLIKAYGLRASEIARPWKSTETASEGLMRLGIFSKHSGIDAGSIWAGATSGPTAVQMHLLACLLARMWSGPEATSVWVDLLDCRRREVQQQVNQGASVDINAIMGVMQKLDRNALAEWDASARSWLRIADAAKELQQKQLLIILGNLDGFVNTKPDAYDSVINAWIAGLKSMEALLEGCPIKAQSGDMLPALSSWHLYPNMNVLDSAGTMVYQRDDLVPMSGILTFGAPAQDHRREDGGQQKGLHWSLPLAHLRFYGDPVQRTSSITAQGTRLTLSDFNMAILGCVLGGWGIEQSDFDGVLRWIRQLAMYLEPSDARDLKLFKRSWVYILGGAAEDYLLSRDFSKRLSTQLLKLGKNHVAFLGRSAYPFFGLAEIDNVLSMTSDVESRVRILRDHAKLAKLPWKHAIIRYISEETGEEEYASAVPRRRLSTKRSDSGEVKTSIGHVRWVRSRPRHHFHGSEPNVIMVAHDHKVNPLITYPSQVAKYESLGEEVKTIEEEHLDSIAPLGKKMRVIWGPLLHSSASILDHYDPFLTIGEMQHYELWLGDPNDAAVFVRIDQATPEQPQALSFRELQRAYDGNCVTYDGNYINPISLARNFGSIVQSLGCRYTQSLSAFSMINSIYTGMKHATIDVRVLERNIASSIWFNTVFGLHTEVWEYAGVDLDTGLSDEESECEAGPQPQPRTESTSQPGSVAQEPIPTAFDHAMARHDFEWQRGPQEEFETQAALDVCSSNTASTPIAKELRNPLMTTAQVFSCILLLDSNFDVGPLKLQNVMAISSNNSLFIAAVLLLDPAKWSTRLGVRHVMGNVGKPGVALLVPPIQPRMVPVGIESWRVINHDDWDGHAQNCFQGSSLHLSFTGATQEIDIGYSGAQDKELYTLESVVSLFAEAQWIADLDIRKMLQNPPFIFQNDRRLDTIPRRAKRPEGETASTSLCAIHTYQDQKYNNKELSITAIENWSELLEKTKKSCIVLASQNWQARLAAAAIAVFQKRQVLFLPDRPLCWRCVGNKTKDAGPIVYIY